MTMPDERYRSILRVGKAMDAVIPYAYRRENQKWARIPAELVRDLHRARRHYIWECHLRILAEKCPELLDAGEGE